MKDEEDIVTSLGVSFLFPSSFCSHVYGPPTQTCCDGLAEFCGSGNALELTPSREGRTISWSCICGSQVEPIFFQVLYGLVGAHNKE